MRFNQPLLAAGLLLSLTTLNAEAALTAYSSAGENLVYSILGNITWTADANLFKTMANSYAGGASAFVNAVIASVPDGKIHDTPNVYDNPVYMGYHSLRSTDFNTTTGAVDWFGAQAFTTYLNSISYGGSQQWRLPTITDTGSPGCDSGYSGTDCGYNVDTATGEMAKLYYDELSAKPFRDTKGVQAQAGYGIGGAVGPFTNVQASDYWSGTEYAISPALAWNFGTYGGLQDADAKNFLYYAWAVSPGQVAAVPVPGAVWLFGTGLLGLLGLKRRGYAG